MRKILTLLIAFMASATSMQAEIYSGTCGYNLTWWLNTEDSTLTINGTGEMENYSSASFVPWAEHKLYVKYLSLSHSITTIGEHAFDGCKSLTSITIPNSIASIGKYGFYDCTGLTEVHISDLSAWCNISFDGVTSNPLYIAKHLYINETEITDLVIPGDVTEIKSYAFRSCISLTSVTIHNSVTSIENDAFSNCSGLTEVHISDLSAWCKISFGNSTSNPLSYARHLYMNGTEITDLVIPNDVTEIKNNAFHNCSGLTSVTIPSSVTNIGKYGFYYCSGLTSVKIPNSVTSIGDHAFAYCSGLTSVTIPDSVTRIEAHVFDKCTGLTSVTIPNSVTSIGTYAFSYCTGLTSVTIPNSITSIENCAFSGCTGLTKVHINDLSAWCKISFSDNPLYNARHLYLNGTEITDLVIPNDVTEIRNKAFFYCSGLTSVTIHNSVTSIENDAFSGCTGLTKVHINDLSAWCKISFGDNPLYNAKHLYMNGTEITDLVIPGDVTEIKRYAFRSCIGLTSITIHNSVTSIENDAFCNCTGLTEVHISDLSAWCKISFGNNTSNPLFYARHLYMNGTEITDLIIPNDVTEIKRFAFSYCTGLTSVKIPNSVTSIGGWAFSYCKSLTSVTIPNSVTSIGNYAFINCPGLTSITCYNDTPPTIEAKTFPSLKTIPLYVLAESVDLYKEAAYWNEYENILPIQATETEVDDFTITWFENNFVLSWYAIENANTYTIEVKDNKDNVVCVLIFNAQGALQSLHFAAPARNGNKQVQTATQTSEGWQFVLNYLDPDRQYTFTLIVKDSEGKELYSKSITNSSTPTSIDNTSIDNTKSAKLLRNGQVLILRGDHTYTLTGQEIK